MKFSSQLEHSFELLRLIDANSHPPDNITKEFFRSRRYLGSHDRRFISETVFGLLRSKRYVEVLTDEYLKNLQPGWSPSAGHLKALAEYVVYRIAVEQSTPEDFIEAFNPSWSEQISGIDLTHFTSWVSSHKTLEFLGGARETRLGIQLSFQDWMVEEWLREFGSETENLLRALNTPARTTLRVNLLKGSREECRLRLHEEGIETHETAISPAGLVCDKRFNRDLSRAFKDGWFEFQDEGSQLVSYLADPKPGMLVIDACAGSGGKTLHIADLMHDVGTVVAFSIGMQQQSELNRRARRAGIQSVRSLLLPEIGPKVDDSRRVGSSTTRRAHEPLAHKAGEFTEKADLVLVDAPCSGSGTIRRDPSTKWTLTQERIEAHAAEQQKILRASSEFVKSGGRLVYATCSLFRKENEDVVNGFLESHKDFVLDDPTDRLPSLNVFSHSGMIRLLPHHHDTDGFFVAVMRRQR